MSHPAALVFALSMAVWVADVRFAPAPEPVAPSESVAACESGLSAETPAGVDAEVVTCGARIAQ
jgi:hypothetical protein